MTGGEYRDYTDMEVDVWLRQMLENLETVTGDEYAAWIFLVDAIMNPGRAHSLSLLALKRRLANSLSDRLIPVFEDERTSETGTERELLRQELLRNIKNFYSLHAATLHRAMIETADFLA